jgi:ubiquinone/menaquinone biosynthesis C-methylase UbiE
MHQGEQAELVRDHYNKVSTTWGDFYDPTMTFSNYNFLVRKQHVLTLFDKRGGRFLDAGCGTGDFVPDLLARGDEVFAVDFAEEMIEQAERRTGGNGQRGRVRFSVGDVCNLGFPADHFDGIIGVGLIEYITDYHAAFEEMFRVLKPGGILVVTVPNIVSPFMAYETFVPKCKGVVKNALVAFGLRQPERAYYQRHFVPWALDRELREIGFRKKDFAYCTYGFFSSRGLESFSLNLTRKLDGYARSPVGVLGTNYIVKVEKP